MTDPDVIRRSVTRQDYAADPYSGSVGMYFVYPTPYSGPTYAPLPAWWSTQRDFVLRGTVHRESMWAAAIAKAITKTAALGWEIADDTDSAQRTRRAQQLYLTALAGMQRGWVPFLNMHLRDYLLTDNGAFVEIVRASSAAGSRIIGLAHLDSARCTRTADPDVPVLYRDRLGAIHELRWWQVLSFSDMPDPSETWNGVGLCAASRAFLTIAKLAAIEQYLYEKSSGDGATELTLLRGVSESQLTSAVVTADAEQKRKGAVYYKGKILTAFLSDTDMQEITIPLKSTPDGFDAKQERDNAYMIYANAIGIPVQDIQPLSGQGLGTGTQTLILAEEAEGQGLASWRQQWLHIQNEVVLPASTTFSWADKNDTRDQKAKAEVAKLRAATRASQIASTEITADEARQLAVDAGDLPREFIASDETPGGVLGDEEKPLTEAPMTEAPPTPTTKAARTEAAALIDRELDAALDLVASVLGR